MKKPIPMAFLLLGLTLPVSACSSPASSSASGSSGTSEASGYGYSLKEDSAKGRAIYPDEAIRILREIKARNAENGLSWPDDDSYSAYYKYIRLGADGTSEFDLRYEDYVPGEYYFRETEAPGAHKAEGYFFDGGEFFHGISDSTRPEEDGLPYYTPSTVDAMEKTAAGSPTIGEIYQEFTGIVESIEKSELVDVAEPRDFYCYSAGPGNLYLNIVHDRPSRTMADERIIRRIVFEDYFPVFAIDQTVVDIFGSDVYRNEYRAASFAFGTANVRDNLAWYFIRRVG